MRRFYEVDDHGVAVITWNRPERRNMWTSAMEDAFYTALDRATADEAVRDRRDRRGAHLLRRTRPAGPRRHPRRVGLHSNRRPQTHATTVPKMIIGAINGSCAGIGLVQALCFDYRFAATGAKFTTAFSPPGLPAEDASAWMLTRLVGPTHAMDLMVSGRVFPSAMRRSDSASFSVCVNRRPCWPRQSTTPGYRRERSRRWRWR